MPIMRQLGIALLVFACCSACAQTSKPLATEFVKCVQSDKGVDVASRKVQTPLIVSERGDRAFAVAAAEFLPGRGCSNTSMLYVAEPHSSFRLIFQQEVEKNPDTSIYDGNGVESIFWSPSGKRLEAVIIQWIWGSDAGINEKYVIFTAGDRKAHEVPALDSVWKHFKQPCVADIRRVGWIDDDRIEMVANPYVSIDEEGEPDGTPSCVQKPVRFSFDVRTGISQPILNPAKH